METQENVAAEDPSISFTQNKTIINIDNSNLNDKVVSKNDLLHNLIEKQANEFEEFGKRMSSDLKNIYKEYIDQQNNDVKINTNSIETENVCNNCNNYDERIDSQSQLIDSLKARIEELETDSLIKEQDIRKLRNEFDDFKKAILGPSSVTAVTSSAAQDNKKNVSLDTNENVIEDSEIPILIQSEEPIKLAHDEEEKFDYKNVEDHERIIFTKSRASYQNQYNDYNQEYEEEPLGEPVTYRNYEEEPVAGLNVFETSFQQHDADDQDFYSYEDGTSYQQHATEEYSNHDDYDSTHFGPSSSFHQYNNYNIDAAYQIGYNSTPSASYQQYSVPLNNSTPREKMSKSQKTNLKIHTRVEGFLVSLNNKKIPDHTFKPLRQNFNTNQLLEYEKSDLFKSLSERAKCCIRISINDELRDELSGKKKLTQPISVYVNRNIVPSLPSNIKSYTEFEKTHHYNCLSNEKKKRIQKIISKEKKKFNY
ncbi:hypothetical protein RclHR1_01000022 [Rhizophagus clarus]|uniref:Uncharacterized protein n=1 Tax=Rhizophagus clarus TaxID=94130 RepID=A0A2Z6QSJ2_9GLOM|nr:hypothetical protein RclHR1_01000022 [Rhizophagus clarus]GES94064.1 hypothetical protein GLOIN_2v1499849 [Rhizophagus clarus]